MSQKLPSTKVGARRLIMLPDLEAYLGRAGRALVSDDAWKITRELNGRLHIDEADIQTAQR